MFSHSLTLGCQGLDATSACGSSWTFLFTFFVLFHTFIQNKFILSNASFDSVIHKIMKIM